MIDFPQHPRQIRRGSLGPVHVCLNLTECDRPLCSRPVGMKNRVVRVFPSLMHEAAGRLSRIGGESRPSRVPIPIDPVQCPLNMRPQRFDKAEVAAPLVVGPGQQDEQRRGIDATIVFPEWDFPQRRHLTLSRFMQNFADLCILLRTFLRRLRRGQIPENPSRRSRIHPEHLQRRNDPVSAERDAEPGNSGIGIRSVRRLRDQHVEIGDGPVQPVVELLVGRIDMSIKGF